MTILKVILKNAAGVFEELKQSVLIFLQFNLYDITCKYNRPSSATVQQIQHVTENICIWL